MSGAGKCFETVFRGQKLKLRAACAVFVDKHNNCLMIEERKLTAKSLGAPTIGFCGGICNEMDSCIEETMIRKIYEDCILRGNLPDNWDAHWSIILKNIQQSPATRFECFIRSILDTLSYCPVYVMSPGAKTIVYYQITLDPSWVSEFLAGGMYLVRPDFLHCVNDLRNQLGTKFCERFPFTVSEKKVRVRDREILVVTKDFIEFIKYGISFIGHGGKRAIYSVTDMIKHKPEYVLCCAVRNAVLSRYDLYSSEQEPEPVRLTRSTGSTGSTVIGRKRRLSKSQDDAIEKRETSTREDVFRKALEQASLFVLCPITEIEWYEIFDFWYRTNQVRVGWYVWIILHSLMMLRVHNVDVGPPALQLLREYIYETLANVQSALSPNTRR